MHKKNTTERIGFLDFLRTVAILLVMAHHYRHLPGTPEWAKWFGLRGYLGVDVFFVLSGWLIGGQLFREMDKHGHLRIWRFWGRRWFRTLPLYYAMLAFHLYTHPRYFDRLAELLFFTQNYTSPHAWLLTWSLCIEEHFYMVLPLILILFQRIHAKAPRFAVSVGVSLVAISPILRWMSASDVSGANYNAFLGSYYVPTHLRMEGLILGVLLAGAAAHQHRVWTVLSKFYRSSFTVGLLLFFIAFIPALTGSTSKGSERQTLFNFVFQFPLVYLSVCLFIVSGMAWHRKGLFLKIPGTQWIAEHAYALYLVHWMASHWISRGVPFPGNHALAIALSFALAAGLRQAIELPGLRLRDRWTS